MKQSFFIHIPKNSGTTLNQVLARNFRKIYAISWDSLSEKHHQRLIASGKTDFDNAELISGHFPYGLHSICHEPDGARYITMLRNPIARSISAYNYLLNDSSYVNINPLLKDYLSKLSIENFYENFHPRVPNHIYSDNGQVRYLSGVGDTKPYGALGEIDLTLAKTNLIKMVFGITDDFDKSMIYFEREFLEHSAVYTTKRKGSHKKSPLPSHVLEAIKSRNSLDIELYGYAVELFKERTRSITDYQMFSYRIRLHIFKLLSFPGDCYRRLIK